MKWAILLLFVFAVFFISQSQTMILNEGFETSSGLPPGWLEIINEPGPNWSYSPVSNTHYLVIPYHSTVASQNEGDEDVMLLGGFLVTPPLNLSSYSFAFLSADVFFKGMSYLGNTESASIQASTDGWFFWTPLKYIEGYFNWHKVYLDVSEYCGQPDVRFAFKYSDNGGWMYGLGIDNVKITVPFANDGSLQSIKKYDFVLLNDTLHFEGVVQNAGADTLNSFYVNWQVNNGMTFIQSFNSVVLAPLDTMGFTHTSTWIPVTQEPFDVKVWISNVNGIPDENPSNDTLTINVINAVSAVPEKKVFLEVFGATWCTICPHGGSKIAEIKDSTENLIIAVIHVNDPFTCDVGTEIYENYHLFPGWLVTGLIDRYNYSDQVSIDMDRYLWPQHVYQREEDISPVELSIANNYNPSTRDLDVFLTATFMCDLEGDFRFNCYVVEDSLVGEQANCLTIPEREPYCHNDSWIYDPPGVIQNYLHMNVLRDVLGGPWGIEGSLPQFIEDGITYDFQFDYTLNEGFNENNIRIIAIVQRYYPDSSKCEVLNAKDMNLDISTSDDFEEIINSSFQVYPNPAFDYLIVETENSSIDCWFEIRNIDGDQVLKRKAIYDKEWIDVSGLESGIYFIKLKVNGLTYIEKIVIL